MAGQETGATPGEQGAEGDTDEHVRLFAFVKRREGLSREEFLQYWRESHGPLIRDTPGLGDKVLRYEQFAARPDDGSPWDGVAMQEFASWEDFLAMLSGDAGAIMRADEGQFLDPSGISVVFTGDRVTMIRRDGSSAPGA